MRSLPLPMRDIRSPVRYIRSPNPANGHMVYVGSYSGNTLHAVTWGMEQPMTRRFLKRCGFAYAVLPQQDWTMQGAAPNGFDFAALQADLAEL